MASKNTKSIIISERLGNCLAQFWCPQQQSETSSECKFQTLFDAKCPFMHSKIDKNRALGLGFPYYICLNGVFGVCNNPVSSLQSDLIMLEHCGTGFHPRTNDLERIQFYDIHIKNALLQRLFKVTESGSSASFGPNFSFGQAMHGNLNPSTQSTVCLLCDRTQSQIEQDKDIFCCFLDCQHLQCSECVLKKVRLSPESNPLITCTWCNISSRYVMSTTYLRDRQSKVKLFNSINSFTQSTIRDLDWLKAESDASNDTEPEDEEPLVGNDEEDDRAID